MCVEIEDDWEVVNRDGGKDDEEGIQNDGATPIAKDANADTSAQDKGSTKQGSETNYKSQDTNSAIQCTPEYVSELRACGTVDTVPREGFGVGGEELAIT